MITSLAASVIVALAWQAVDEGLEYCDWCDVGGGGIYVGLTAELTAALETTWPPGADPEVGAIWYSYSAVIQCPGNGPDNPDDALCQPAIDYCEERMPSGSGPYSRIYRRTYDAEGPQSAWESVAFTCFTDMVPARSGDGAELTEAMIIEQFHRTDFALPATLIQPPDNRALVNLPVYFDVGWPEDGYAPDEVDTTTILGREVRIRPTFHEATYNFGDGTVTGPTTSQGGPWPDGDITHEYTDAASVSTSVSVVYGGEVSIDGGPWTVIPSTVSVTGPAQPLEILTSSNRLYDN